MAETIERQINLGDLVRYFVSKELLASEDVIAHFGREAILGTVGNVAKRFDSVTIVFSPDISYNIILGEN